MTKTKFISNDGFVYTSMSRFAKVHGFPRSTVKDAMSKHKTFTRNGLSLKILTSPSEILFNKQQP